MSNDYFDTYSALTPQTLGRSGQPNAIFDAIIAGFDKLPTVAKLKEDRVTYAADSGTADAYLVALDAAVIAYNAGLRVSMKVGNSNTGPATLNVNSIGVKAIKRYDGGALAANDLLAAAIVDLVYDGAAFRLISPNASDVTNAAGSASAAAGSALAAAASAGAASASAGAAAASAGQAAASATTAGATVSQFAIATGTANAQVGTFPTTVTVLTDTLVLGFRAVATNTTTTPTFKADGTTARTITRDGGQALLAGDIAINGEYLVRYNLANTRWELLNPRGSRAPTFQKLTSGSGATYTPTSTLVRFIKVRGVGGGAGGSGSRAGAANGTAGGNSIFNGYTVTGGAVGAFASGLGGVGGSGGADGSGALFISRTTGQNGGSGNNGTLLPGAAGGSSILGLGGQGVYSGTGATGTGYGAGGQGAGDGSASAGGVGGAAAEGAEMWFVAASYTYTIGAAGTGGAGGAGGQTGGAGSPGVWIVEEFY